MSASGDFRRINPIFGMPKNERKVPNGKVSGSVF